MSVTWAGSPARPTRVGPRRERSGWKETAMRIQRRWWSVLVAAVLGGLVGVTAVAAAGAQFLPILGAREGAQRSLQIPIANGYIDYVTLLNERDGGINGVPLVWGNRSPSQKILARLDI